MASETTFVIDPETGEMIQHYKCNGQSYYIPEVMCDARQDRDNKNCSRCTLRKGGKNDPRKRKETNDIK